MIDKAFEKAKRDYVAKERYVTYQERDTIGRHYEAGWRASEDERRGEYFALCHGGLGETCSECDGRGYVLFAKTEMPTLDGQRLCKKCYMTYARILAMEPGELSGRVAVDVCGGIKVVAGRLLPVGEFGFPCGDGGIEMVGGVFNPIERWDHLGMVIEAMQKLGYPLELIPIRAGYTVRWLAANGDIEKDSDAIACTTDKLKETITQAALCTKHGV